MAKPSSQTKHLVLSPSTSLTKLLSKPSSSSPAPAIPSKSKEDFIRLCSRGPLREALQGFHFPHIWSDPNLFSHLLQRCCRGPPHHHHSLLRHGRQLHAFIITSGASADRFTSNHLLNMYSKLGDLPTASAIFHSMPRKNIMSSNILIGGFVQNGDLRAARQVFDQMPERNVATWNAMVAGLTHFGFDDEGLELLVQMRRLGLRPDEFSLGSVLRCCAGITDIGSGRQIHAYVILSGFQYDLCVGSSLAHMYMKCGRLEEGEMVLKGLPVLNVVSCNTIIAGRTQNGDPEGALDQFVLMKAGGLAPDEVTFVGVISSCSDLAALGQGQQVHAHVIKAGVDSMVPVRSSLVTMYSRCGCLSDSTEVFSESDEPDLVLWSAMIAAYGFHGYGQEAIELFEEMMRLETEPSEVTFLSLLYACSHSGLKDKGMEYFKLMTQKYGLRPSLKHYTCIVDLLGRSGCLDEAEELIKSMPVCHVHKNKRKKEGERRWVSSREPGPP